MIRLIVAVLLLCAVVTPTLAFLPIEEHYNYNSIENRTVQVQMYTDVVSDPTFIPGSDGSPNIKIQAVTPHGYKATMMRYSGNGRRNSCWRCSYPVSYNTNSHFHKCAAYYCCDDGYPQCCLYRNSCMCCRR